MEGSVAWVILKRGISRDPLRLEIEFRTSQLNNIISLILSPSLPLMSHILPRQENTNAASIHYGWSDLLRCV